MNNIFQYLSKNIVSALLVTVLTGLTVTTSAAGTAKLLGSINSFKPTVPEVKDIQTIEDSQKSKVPTPTVKTNETKTENVISNTIKKIVATVTPTLISSGNNNTAQNNNTCIITLFGKQYDVFSLQTTHSGGNVFTCNSDMTSVYQGQHGTDVSRMQKYLVTSTGTTNSNSGSSTSTVTGSGSSSTSINKDDDTDNDREDNNEEERLEKKEVDKIEDSSD